MGKPDITEYGIGARILIERAYNTGTNGVPNPAIVSYIDQLNMQWVRTSIGINDDGSISSNIANRLFTTTGDQDYNGIVPQLWAKNIKMLPVLLDRMFHTPRSMEDSPLWVASDTEVYQAGYTLAFGFVNQYKDNFHHLYELTNEAELFRSGVETPPGETAGQYYPWFLNPMSQYIAGMNDGVKAADPLAKTIVNTAGYWKLAFWESMFNTAAQHENEIDYCGVHWYNHAAWALEQSHGVRFPTEILYGLFGKKLMYTEYGCDYNPEVSQAENHIRQLDFYKEAEAHFSQHKDVIALLSDFELLDSVAVSGTYDTTEQNYGLIWFPDYANTLFQNPVPKPLGEYLGL